MIDPARAGLLPAQTTGAHASRLPALDGLRGIAILLVLQYHFWNLAFGLGGYETTNGVDEWVGKVIGVGWSGVDLFFVLSGFLITGILYDAKSSQGYFRSFYARRTLRIVPIYAMFLLFVLIVLPLIPFLDETADIAQVSVVRDNQFWFWTYLVNVGASISTFDATIPLVHAHFWSLAVEEQFYLVWPFVVLTFCRRTLIAICCAMVVGAFAIRFTLTAGFAPGVFEHNAAGVLMPARMDTLALGGLIALAYRGSELGMLRRAAPALMLISVAGLIGLFVKNNGLPNANPDIQRYGYTFVALCFAGFLLFTVDANPGSLLHRVLTQPILRTFGRYSYAIYVVHLLLAFALARRFIKNDWMATLAGSHIPLNITFSLVATTGALAIAWATWRLIEQPFLRLKSHFPYRATDSTERAARSSFGPKSLNVEVPPDGPY